MKKKMMKALKDLNAYIDDDRQKLCDRLHDMELSHKRMERLLKRTAELLSYISTTEDQVQEVHYLFLAIMNELSYPYFRKNERIKNG